MAYFWQKQKANMGLRKRQTAHERTNHTTEREIKPKHSLLKPDSPISLHTLAQIVSAYCLLGWLTEWFIGYDPDWECNDLKLHVLQFQGVVSTQQFVLMLLWHAFINHRSASCTVGKIVNPQAYNRARSRYQIIVAKRIPDNDIMAKCIEILKKIMLSVNLFSFLYCVFCLFFGK